MTNAETLYLLPYVISLGLSISVLIYTWQRHRIKGTGAYIWLVSAQALWTLGYIIELLSPNLTWKLFWDGIEWIASGIAIIALPVFVIQYTEHKLRYARLFFQLSLIVPVLFTILVLTDSTHHWVRLAPFIKQTFPLVEVSYKYTSFAIGYFIYSYMIALIGIGFLIHGLLQPHNLFRAQIAIIIAGILIPIIGTILSLLGIKLSPWQDPVPLTIAIGNLVIVVGIYRYQIFEIVPVGRDKVFEDMVDSVVILDNQNLILDINRAMLDLLGRKASQVVGQPAKKVFMDFPIPIKLYTHVTHARAETNFELHGKAISYELTVWPMYDQKKNLVGRIFVSHDITAMKELENDLRNLNQILEQRVEARTKELAEAYDTTLEGWAGALELRDKETEGHSRRVMETTLKVARALKIPEDELIHIRRGAILHDIGKMAIPDEILRKAGKLTEEERHIMQQHPEIAQKLLERIPYLNKALEIPYCHHEKYDGSGYPRGLKGTEIPLSARIFAVADVWDAVQSDRPYNKGWSREKTIEYIKAQSDHHFDPKVVDTFLKLIEQGKI